MKIRLGYACISNIINVSSSRGMTLTLYNKLDDLEKFEKLDYLIKSNLGSLESLIRYNIKNNIHFFRISAKLIPFMDLYDIDLSLYNDKFTEIGRLINDNDMRVDVHVDEFCVLNSIREDVVIKSIKILENLKCVMDMFGVCYNIIMHIGSKSGGVKESIKRFIKGFSCLSDDLQKLIILENDDKCFNVSETLNLCEELGIPMCLDIHHHNFNGSSLDISFYLDRIYKTYNGNIAKMHFSSSKNKREFRSHSEFVSCDDFIRFVELLKSYDIDTDIMIEAKGKDMALVKLMYELKYLTNYYFIDESSFCVKF